MLLYVRLEKMWHASATSYKLNRALPDAKCTSQNMITSDIKPQNFEQV